MININIKATNTELTQPIRDYVNEKIGSLEKFILTNREERKGKDDEIQAWVEVGLTTKHHQSGGIYRAEAQIRLPHGSSGENPYVVSEKEGLYAAIDDIKDQMQRELIHLKTKKRSVIMRGARKIKGFLLGK